jgi:DNA-binding transcriptional LysR family regulator
MHLADVAVFVLAHERGSLAAAARHLGIAPMIASRRLSSLEDQLGVRLIHRTTRALSLTPEGQAFLPHAHDMLEGEAHARASVTPANAKATGLLRLTASAPFGRKVISPMLPAFLDENPDLKIDLLLTDSIIDIVANGLDLAIRIANLHDSSLVARKLVDSPRVLCASPAYVDRYGSVTKIADLANHECLTLTSTKHWDFLTQDGIVRQRISGRYSSNTLEALHQACLDGMGVAVLSWWNVRDEIASGELQKMGCEDAKPVPFDVWAVYPTNRFVPPKVHLFISALKRTLVESHAPLG